ncbi:unnamed protein product [Hermetia illucens]|uniref:Uncharacterized protein n=1 Tax=Hermetia illucens TaxID=343691 RepID=A0A7R8UYI2_HERIL|nr:unnamed protein product [Hermetia illucens]
MVARQFLNSVRSVRTYAGVAKMWNSSSYNDNFSAGVVQPRFRERRVECTHCNEVFTKLNHNDIKQHYRKPHSSHHKICSECAGKVYSYRDLVFEENCLYHKCTTK